MSDDLYQKSCEGYNLACILFDSITIVCLNYTIESLIKASQPGINAVSLEILHIYSMRLLCDTACTVSTYAAVDELPCQNNN